MKKFFLSIIFTIILGVFAGNFLCNYVHAKDSKTLYLLSTGSYIDYKEALKDSNELNNKIIIEKDVSYDVIIGASFNKSNLNKISKIYKNKGYTYFIKEEEISDKEFIKNMNNFDLILKSSTKKDEINKINGIILSYYEEKFIK